MEELLVDVAERGRLFLDRLELPDAESAFRAVLQRLGAPSPGCSNPPGGPRAAVTALIGLGEVYARLGRQLEPGDPERLRTLCHSLLMYTEALSVARHAARILRDCSEEEHSSYQGLDGKLWCMEEKSDDVSKTRGELSWRVWTSSSSDEELQQNADDLKHFQQMMSRASMQAKFVEDCLATEVRDCVVKHCTRPRHDENELSVACALRGAGLVRQTSLPGMLIPPLGSVYPALPSHTHFDSAWLHNVLTPSCCELITPVNQTVKVAGVSDDSHANNALQVSDSPPVADLSAGGIPDTDPSNTPPQRKKINFGAVQDAIQRLVSQVSTEVRSQYSRRVPRALLEKRLSSEIIMRLSPGSPDNLDLVSAFEEAIHLERGDIAFQESASTTDGSTSGGTIGRGRSLDVELCCEDCEMYSSGSENENFYETIDLEVPPSGAHETRKKKKMKKLGNVSTKELTSSSCRTSYVTTLSVKLSAPSASSPSAKEVVNSSQQILTEAGKKRNLYSTSQSNARVTFPGTSDCDFIDSYPHGVLCLWKSTKATTLLEPNSHTHLALDSMEELSAFTESDRSLNFLTSSAGAHPLRSELGESRHLNVAKLSQTIARVAVKVADALMSDKQASEAVEVYKYALGLFLEHPPSAPEKRVRMVADVLLALGEAKCCAGDAPSGVQLLEECAALYGGTDGEAASSADEVFRAAEIHFRLGNALLDDSYRQELLMARLMTLTKREIMDHSRKIVKKDSTRIDNDDDSDVDDDSDEEEGEEEEEEEYTVCNEEAMQCYKDALSMLDRYHCGDGEAMPSRRAELYLQVFSSLADCLVIAGHFERALELYERTLPLFQRAPGGAHDLLVLNAHVLSMIGTINFLTRNWVRAATMYEISHVLRQHLQGVPDEPSLEMGWTLCMLSLSYHQLGSFHKCVVCCVRAFTLYVRLYGGRVLDLDPLGHWFVVQTLYMLGHAYRSLGMNDKAATHLALCRNLATRATSGREDRALVARVLHALADTHEALGDRASAEECYAQAIERSRAVGDYALAELLQRRVRGSDVTGGGGLYGDDVMTGRERMYGVESSIRRDVRAMLGRLGVTGDVGRYSGGEGSGSRGGSPPCVGEAGEELCETMASLGALTREVAARVFTVPRCVAVE